MGIKDIIFGFLKGNNDTRDIDLVSYFASSTSTSKKRRSKNKKIALLSAVTNNILLLLKKNSFFNHFGKTRTIMTRKLAN
jgi:hypothetical protein